VPVVFFELWPVKGFQYLLPAGPPIAVLAGRALSRWWRSWERAAPGGHPGHRLLVVVVAATVAASLLVSTWERVDGAAGDSFLAGSGGLPGGREAGEWIDRSVPSGSTFMTIGPSMANLVQYYGHRRAYGLSVSPNPLDRNPSYEPLTNPDQAIRDSELQYVVWDAFSAGRSAAFSEKLRGYVRRYHGRVIHTDLLPAMTERGRTAQRPAIVVYEVRP
jgi:hypothetical protein